MVINFIQARITLIDDLKLKEQYVDVSALPAFVGKRS